MIKKVELLAPAGNFVKMKAAFKYGADAVYAGGTNFSLRERSGNFSMAEMEQAVNYAHALKKKFYVALNIFAHQQDIEQLPPYISQLGSLAIDAIIASDPGVIRLIKKHAPHIEIHLSTQANTTNAEAVNFWHELGVARIVLARELSLDEIKKIRQHTNAELEVFVHGAMCMAYSGRCLISNFLTERGANQGDCSQSCRWNYELVEAKRPGEYHPIEEDSRGTYFFNANDLNLLPYINHLIESGVNSLKVEGRVKSENYVSTVIRSYRTAIDSYYNQETQPTELLMEELERVSHRHYSTGFLWNKPNQTSQNYDKNMGVNKADFLGKVIDFDGRYAIIESRAKFSVGEKVQFMRNRLEDDFEITVSKIFLENDEEIPFTKPNTKIKLKIDKPVELDDILRRLH